MRPMLRSSNWLNEIALSRTAVYSLIGIEISPKLIVPVQIARAIDHDGTCDGPPLTLPSTRVSDPGRGHPLPGASGPCDRSPVPPAARALLHTACTCRSAAVLRLVGPWAATTQTGSTATATVGDAS